METAHSTDQGCARRPSDRIHTRQRIIATRPAKPPPRSSSGGTLALLASALIAGFFLAPVIEVGGAFAGLWSAPAHSEQILDNTSRSAKALETSALAVPIVRLQQQASVWQHAILSMAPLHPESTPARYLVATGNRLQTTLLRLAALAAFAHYLGAVILVSIIEALVTREKRRLLGGREHGFVFHRLGSVRTAVTWLPFFLFLAAPATLPSAFVPLLMIPLAAYLFFHMVLFKRNV